LRVAGASIQLISSLKIRLIPPTTVQNGTSWEWTRLE